MNILIALSVYYSCVLYLAGKDLMPVVVNSHYETGYLTIGRASIYMICFINLVGGFGLMMIYFIVFGDTTASIIHQLCYPNTSNFLTTKACYVLILGLCLAYPVSKKQLGEIKILSILLFLCIGLFFIMMLV
jgi:amino acid permease